MKEVAPGLGILLLAIVLFFVIRWWRKSRELSTRAKLMAQALSKSDWVMIDRAVPILQKMPKDLRMKIDGLVQVMLAEKSFEACGGLSEVTREMKLVVLAQAAMLLVGRSHDFYPHLRSILLYPDAYQSSDEEEGHSVRLGESWGSGSVVLAWKSVLAGSRNDEDGQNVVLHEFAHQLDQEDGSSDGLPVLAEGMSHAAWAAAFRASYEGFCEDVDAGKRTVLDDYGATNPAEFFAVATETFFEKAEQLRDVHGEVYGQLKAYYGVDPAEWGVSPAAKCRVPSDQ